MRAAPPLLAPRYARDFSHVPIQAKMKVGPAGDAFEREADRVADAVMKTPEPRAQRSCACGGSCDDCGSKDDEPHPAPRISRESDGVIQRKIRFTDAEPEKRAPMLQSWLDELCERGKFIVDPKTGSITAASKSVCRNPKKRGCQCLCDAMSTAKDIEIRIGDKLTYSLPTDDQDITMDEEIDVAGTGGGVTVQTPKWALIGMRTQERAFFGAGETSPQPTGTNPRNKLLRTPDWLTLGHELCGHALKGKMEHGGHFMTPEGNRTPIDVENQLRREHSTLTDSMGIRHGTFYAELVADWPFVQMKGAMVRVQAGDTLASFARRANISQSSMLDQIYRSDGKRIPEERKDQIAPGEGLLVEGVSWHTVIEGETAASIAAMWAITTGDLERANPRIKKIRPGTRLLIPAKD